MKNNKYIRIIMYVLLVLVAGYFGWKLGPFDGDNEIIPNVQNEEITYPAIEGNAKDLVSFSVLPGQEVFGVLNVAGAVQGGYFFEANIILNILDEDKDLLRQTNGNAKTDWMTSGPVGFDAVLDFSGLKNGLAFIEIHNDNASGLPENDKSILIPVIINNK